MVNLIRDFKPDELTCWGCLEARLNDFKYYESINKKLSYGRGVMVKGVLTWWLYFK